MRWYWTEFGNIEMVEYRMDIGQPADFVKAGDLYLNYLAKTFPDKLDKGEHIVGPALIDPSTKIGPGAKIGPNVIIGPNCVIGEGVKLKNVCLMGNTTVSAHSYVVNSLIGWFCKIGSWCRIEGLTVFGEDVVVKDELTVNGAIVMPHKCIAESVRTSGSVLL